MRKAGGLPFGMLIVLGRLHTMSISKSIYSNCAVLTKYPKFPEMYIHNTGIALIFQPPPAGFGLYVLVHSMEILVSSSTQYLGFTQDFVFLMAKQQYKDKFLDVGFTACKVVIRHWLGY